MSDYGKYQRNVMSRSLEARSGWSKKEERISSGSWAFCIFQTSENGQIPYPDHFQGAHSSTWSTLNGVPNMRHIRTAIR
jgi:hypothetical protein